MLNYQSQQLTFTGIVTRKFRSKYFMRFFTNFIGLIASILTILNFVLAVPSVFKNIKGIELLEITNKNFSLKLGFVLILEIAFGYILTSLLILAQRNNNTLAAHTSGILIILTSAWLTIFNITEILYYDTKINSFFGFSSILLISMLLQGALIILSSDHREWNWNSKKLNWLLFLFSIEIIYFIVYILNIEP